MSQKWSVIAISEVQMETAFPIPVSQACNALTRLARQSKVPCRLRSTTLNYPFLEKPGIIGRYQNTDHAGERSPAGTIDTHGIAIKE